VLHDNATSIVMLNIGTLIFWIWFC